MGCYCGVKNGTNAAEIPVVMATDINYLHQTTIVIYTALLHASNNKKFHFHILVSPGLKRTVELYLGIITKNYCCTITVLEISERIDAQMRISHITKPTFYRLFIPKLLSKYEKCIYLDVTLLF